MSSIHTNHAAMAALQTLRATSDGLLNQQEALGTGKDIATARDDSALWAISKSIESDVAGFQAIRDNLGLGIATTGVARSGAENISDILTKIQQVVVNANEANVDRDKLQADFASLRDQVDSIAKAAQFNGLNLLRSTAVNTDLGGHPTVLASINRSGSDVQTDQIVVSRRDLQVEAAAYTTAGYSAVSSGTYTVTTANSTQASVLSIAPFTTGTAAGDLFRFQVGGTANDVTIGLRQGESDADLLDRITTALNFVKDESGVEWGNFVANRDTMNVDFEGTESATGTFAVQMSAAQGATASTSDYDAVGGGLGLLQAFDISTEDGARAALGAMDNLIQASVDAAASFGADQKTLGTQEKLVTVLSDTLKSGIGVLVDADLEERSARLEALQVQQQLGVQALSIANQSSQQLLTLFR